MDQLNGGERAERGRKRARANDGGVLLRSLAQDEKNRKKASHSQQRPLSSAATRSIPSQTLFLSLAQHSAETNDNSTTAQNTKKQIFSELASLGPVVPSEEANDNGRAGGQLVTGVFPFRTSDDVVEPHPGLRAYPFLGQVRCEREREKKGEKGTEERESERRESFSFERPHGVLFLSRFRPLFFLRVPGIGCKAASVQSALRATRDALMQKNCETRGCVWGVAARREFRKGEREGRGRDLRERKP
jgi:hypothetical protein